MKVKYNGLEEWVYIFLCVLSLGTVWLTRIVISMAIREALEK